jgi:hypothetical protein
LDGESCEHDSQRTGKDTHFPFAKAQHDLVSRVEDAPRDQINNGDDNDSSGKYLRQLGWLVEAPS